MMNRRVCRTGSCRNSTVAGGYTLIEMMVVMTLFGIMTTLLIVGYPLIQAREKFVGAEQQIQSVVRSAQQMAIHEDRAEQCLELAEGRDPNEKKECRRRCSDIGVRFDGSDIITFAYLDNDDLDVDCGADVELSRQGLPEDVMVSSSDTLVFLGVPPTVTLSIEGRERESGQVTISVGDDELVLTVWRYGHVSRD